MGRGKPRSDGDSWEARALAGVGTGITGPSYGPVRAPCLPRGIQHPPGPSLPGQKWE